MTGEEGHHLPAGVEAERADGGQIGGARGSLSVVKRVVAQPTAARMPICSGDWRNPGCFSQPPLLNLFILFLAHHDTVIEFPVSPSTNSNYTT